VDFGKLLGRGGFQLSVELFTPLVGSENRVEKRNGRRRVFLIDRADCGVLRQQNFTAERHKLANDQPEQGGFSDPVASNHADFRPGRDGDAGRIEKSPAPCVKDKFLDPKHIAAAEVGLSGRRRAGVYRATPAMARVDAIRVVAIARSAMTTLV